MIRRIIKINEEKCNGCGICAAACHEGAIGMVDGKAKLLRDDYCDGLGDCLPACPTGAITFEEREAAAYDEAAVKAKAAKEMGAAGPVHTAGHSEAPLPCGCPGSQSRAIPRPSTNAEPSADRSNAETAPDEDRKGCSAVLTSQLSQWPVQIKLVPVKAPYFNGAKLLIAADCTAYAYANFHSEFIKGKITLIGCPKLDSVDYSEKLTEIIKNNDIKSLTVVRMEVPCCGGIEHAAKNALLASGKFIPWQIVTISTDGQIPD